MATRQINLRLDLELLEKIDRDRGMVPRNVWMVRCLELIAERNDEILANLNLPLVVKRSPEPAVEVSAQMRPNPMPSSPSADVIAVELRPKPSPKLRSGIKPQPKGK
jgi:hypothetical protein